MHPTLDIEAIARAIGERPEVRARLARDYGLQVPPEDPVAFSNALVRAFDQTPLGDPLAVDPSPRDVFRCAVLALGSNSRSWVAFLRRRDQLEQRLHAFDPGAVAGQVLRGTLTAEDLREYFPGITGRADANAVLRWAEKVGAGRFLDQLRCLVQAVASAHRAQFGADPPAGSVMPLLAICLAYPSRRFPAEAMVPEYFRPLEPADWKLPGMGAVLASEFFRNLGWSGFKPDRHVMRLLDLWCPDVVAAQEDHALRLAALIGKRDKVSTGFLRYSLAGQAVTPPGVSYSLADNLIWALGAYVEKKGRESGRRYLRDP